MTINIWNVSQQVQSSLTSPKYPNPCRRRVHLHKGHLSNPDRFLISKTLSTVISLDYYEAIDINQFLVVTAFFRITNFIIVPLYFIYYTAKCHIDEFLDSNVLSWQYSGLGHSYLRQSPQVFTKATKASLQSAITTVRPPHNAFFNFA